MLAGKTIDNRAHSWNYILLDVEVAPLHLSLGMLQPPPSIWSGLRTHLPSKSWAYVYTTKMEKWAHCVKKLSKVC